MIGRTLGFYFARIFALWIAGIFLAVAALVFLLDYIEVVRQNSTIKNFSLIVSAEISLLRIPVILEQIIPFAVLLGAMAAFMTLSRRIELIVGRAIGLSVWQFAFPGATFAFLLGICTSTLFNPFAVAMHLQSDLLTDAVRGTHVALLTQGTDITWARQKTPSGHSILHVASISPDGTRLYSPTLWDFDQNGSLVRRIDAHDAVLADHTWHLGEPMVTDAITGRIERPASLDEPTDVTATQIRESLGNPENVSFWSLPETVRHALDSGLPAYRFRLKLQEHFAKPLFLVAMVGIAAAVGLGLTRSGGTGIRILGGVVSGFVLYVISKVTGDLGGVGLIAPEMAAWTPPVVAMLFAVTVLLYREDG